RAGGEDRATARAPWEGEAGRLAANLFVEAALESRQPLGVGPDESEDVRGELAVRIHPAWLVEVTHAWNTQLEDRIQLARQRLPLQPDERLGPDALDARRGHVEGARDLGPPRAVVADLPC